VIYNGGFPERLIVFGGKIMKRRAGEMPLIIAFYFLMGLLCMAFFVGCTDHNTNLPSNIDNGKVTISWNNVPGAISYNIYFSRTAGETKWNSIKIPNAPNPITIIDLALGKTYYFGIAVVGESGEGSVLSEKAYTVTSVDGLLNFSDLTPESQNFEGRVTKKQVSKGQVTLAWDNDPNAASYNIYYRDSPGVTKQNGKKIANVTNPYTVKGLKGGKTYYFAVTAVTKSGESKESKELSFQVK